MQLVANFAAEMGLPELAVVASILVILIELVLERGGSWISGGWYRSERSFSLDLETDTPEATLQVVRQVLHAERITHMLVDYEAAKKSENVKIGLTVGLPEKADTEKLTLQFLSAGARSVSWRLAKD